MVPFIWRSGHWWHMRELFSGSRQIFRLTTNFQTRKGHKYTHLRERSLVTGRGVFSWISGIRKSSTPPKTESEYRPPPPRKRPPLPVTNERSLIHRCKSCAFYAFCAFFSSFFVPVLIFANQLKHFFTFLSRGVELDLVIFLIFQNFSNYFFMDSWHQIVSLSIIIIEMIIVAL